jgi:hypothetical protein
MKWKALLWSGSTLVALAACALPIVLGMSVDDASGDTIGSGSTSWDLLNVTTRSVGTRAELLLSFDRTVVLTAPGTALVDNDLRGFVALDTDGDATTPAGNPLAALLLGACPEVASLGIDLLIEVFERSGDGRYLLRRPSLAADDLVHPRAGGNTLTLSLPLAELDDLEFDIGIEVGSESVVDCLPDSV